MTQVFSRNPLGFNFKGGDNVKTVTLNADDCWNADFCSMRLWPVMRDGRLWFEWGPMPERILLKTFWMKVEPHGVEERAVYCREVCKGLREFSNVVPLFSGLVATLAFDDVDPKRVVSSKRVKRIKPDLDCGEWKPSRGATCEFSEITVQTFARWYPETARWLAESARTEHGQVRADVRNRGFFKLPPLVAEELYGIATA